MALLRLSCLVLVVVLVRVLVQPVVRHELGRVRLAVVVGVVVDQDRGAAVVAQQATTDSGLDLLCEIEMTEQRASRHLNLHMALEMILLRLRDAVAASSVPLPA